MTPRTFVPRLKIQVPSPKFEPNTVARKASPSAPFLYCYRNLVERFYGKLKQARGIATRYDKRADNFPAAIKLSSPRPWIIAYDSPQ